MLGVVFGRDDSYTVFGFRWLNVVVVWLGAVGLVVGLFCWYIRLLRVVVWGSEICFGLCGLPYMVGFCGGRGGRRGWSGGAWDIA